MRLSVNSRKILAIAFATPLLVQWGVSHAQTLSVTSAQPLPGGTIETGLSLDYRVSITNVGSQSYSYCDVGDVALADKGSAATNCPSGMPRYSWAFEIIDQYTGQTDGLFAVSTSNTTQLSFSPPHAFAAGATLSWVIKLYGARSEQECFSMPYRVNRPATLCATSGPPSPLPEKNYVLNFSVYDNLCSPPSGLLKSCLVYRLPVASTSITWAQPNPLHGISVQENSIIKAYPLQAPSVAVGQVPSAAQPSCRKSGMAQTIATQLRDMSGTSPNTDYCVKT